mmetsp:Transcript_60126/g.193548  ORF Transcript_60126/g.193548 Transcript_60126/m.193548 type:complete len:204 (+) Transcript_60126:1304-1915(+)
MRKKPLQSLSIFSPVVAWPKLCHSTVSGSLSCCSIVSVLPLNASPPAACIFSMASSLPLSVSKTMNALGLVWMLSRSEWMCCSASGSSSSSPGPKIDVSKALTFPRKPPSAGGSSSGWCSSGASRASAALCSFSSSIKSLSSSFMTVSWCSWKSQATETPTTGAPPASTTAALSSSSTRSEPFRCGIPSTMATKSFMVLCSKS